MMVEKALVSLTCKVNPILSLSHLASAMPVFFNLIALNQWKEGLCVSVCGYCPDGGIAYQINEMQAKTKQLFSKKEGASRHVFQTYLFALFKMHAILPTCNNNSERRKNLSWGIHSFQPQALEF